MEKWQRAVEKNEMNKGVEFITKFIQSIQEQDEEKYQEICKLKEQLEQNKTEKEKELEEKVKQLKEKLNEWERSEELYGFTPKEREVIQMWHKKHFDEENDVEIKGFVKAPRHGHITYSIDIHPEVLIKSAKCSTCGKELIIYDAISDMWEFDKDGNNKKKVKVSDLK